MLSYVQVAPPAGTAMDEVTLIVGGKTFLGWTGVSIESNVETCADGFSLTMPFDPSRLDLLASFQPWTIARLYIGNDLVLTGYLEDFPTHHDATTRTMTVGGRSLTGQLVDCVWEGGRDFNWSTLGHLAAQLAQPYGIQVVVQNDTGVITLAKIEDEETVFKFLDRIAQGKSADGLSIPGVTRAIAKISGDERGRLVIAPPYPSGAPVASLIEGQGPYLGGDSDYNATRRFSRYCTYVEGDQAGVPLGQASDPAVKLYRPTAKLTGAIYDQDPNLLAKYERGMAYLSSSTFSVVIAGWRVPKQPAEDPATGPVWRKNMLVTVKAPSIRVPKEAQFMVAGVRMQLSGQTSKTTTLRLAPPGSYVGQLPAVEPWQ